MSGDVRKYYWLAAILILIGGLWLLSEVLFPFVAGMALAYLFDPLLDKIERWKCPRWVGAAILTLFAIILVLSSLLLIIPLLNTQLVELSVRIPGYLNEIQTKVLEFVATFQSHLTEEDVVAIKQRLSSAINPEFISWLGGILSKIWDGGVALLNLLSLLFITPIVMFYLLRDWDRIVEVVDSWLPRPHLLVIREQFSNINSVLSAFVRGQVLVCTILGVFYGSALSIIGLDFGFIIGLGTGLISFVPYFGMLLGFVIGVGVAIAQFGEWVTILGVASIFCVGQFLEGNYITPKLVGNKIGLHPVWVIFALMAGGTLLGFTGLLIAIPAAAIIGVLGRFSILKYKAGSTYSAPKE